MNPSERKRIEGFHRWVRRNARARYIEQLTNDDSDLLEQFDDARTPRAIIDQEIAEAQSHA